MNQIQLYLNNQLVDLSDDSPIALTFQINNLAEVKNQQGNTSNQFKLPLTQRNRQVLGFPDDVAFTTNLPYDNYEAKIIQDGLEIVPSAIAQLNLIEQDTASITVLSGNVDFFDALDVNIYDMGDKTTPIGQKQFFAPYVHSWTVENIARSQTNISGYIWPVVDYGRIPVEFKTDTSINVRYMRPGFFLKTAIELFVKAAGYKIDPGSFLLKQPMYEKLIVQFANDDFGHGADYQAQPDELGMLAYTASDQSARHTAVSDPFGKGIFKFSDKKNDPQFQFDGSTFVAKRVFTGQVLVTIPKFYFRGRKNDKHPSNLNVIIYLEIPEGVIQYTLNYDLAEWTRIQGTSGGGLQGEHTFSIKTIPQQIDFQPGYRLSVRWEFFGDEPEQFTMYSGASLSIKAINQNVLYEQDIQCERIFPDITQKDLLKDTLQRFGIICQTNNVTRTVTFSSFRDIVNNIPVAHNWTTKCLDQGKTVSFQLGNYAQVNTMTCKQDDAILPANLGNSEINVKDKTLSLSTSLFESQFAATLNRPYIGGSIAQILKIDTTQDADATDFSISTQPRLLIDQKMDLRGQAGSPSVTFTDGNNNIVVNDVVSVPYFYKSDGEHSLLWNDLRLLYYPELEKILQQTKKVVRYFLLNPRDILELDLLIPVYLEQDGCYYYINKIDSWRKGQPTKVELVKLG